MSAPDPEHVKILVTLAGLAYGTGSDLPRYLAQDALTRGDLDPVWIADDANAPDNYAFLVQSRATGAYTLAIRGTYPNPLSSAYWNDGDEDSPFGAMQPWPGAEKIGAKIAAGTSRGFTNVLGLSDGSRKLQDLLLGLAPNARLAVTGHSLGGTLSPVVALWLAERRPDLDLLVVPFAGMTPGNLAFRSLFGIGARLNGRVFRYNNTLDTVGYGWDRVLSTWFFYRPHPRGGLLVQLFLAIAAIRLWFYGFAAIGPEMKLTGALKPPATKSELLSYVIENLQQHLPSTYLDLLGAPPLPFEIGFGAVVSEQVTPTPAALAKGKRGHKVYFTRSAILHRQAG